MKVYLAGPMSGIPQFNFPEFFRVAKLLRESGYEVVSPAEEDYKHGVGQVAEKSIDGDPTKLAESWGTILARDVRLIADDGIEGIVFLPGWEKSRGARLEASVGLLCGLKFYRWDADAQEMSSLEVATELFVANALKRAA